MQLCVYVGKTCIINVYGSYKNEAQYNENSMQVCINFDKIWIIYFFKKKLFYIIPIIPKAIHMAKSNCKNMTNLNENIFIRI